MKQICCGSISTKSTIRQRLVASSIMFIVMGGLFTLYISSMVENEYLGSIGYGLLWLIGLPCVYFYKQHQESKDCIVFDEHGFTKYHYPNQMYWYVFRNKPPEKKYYAYRDFTSCELTYEVAGKNQHNEYQLQLIFSNREVLFIQPSELSKQNLKYLLLLLSSRIHQFHDPYQLQLCLIQNDINMDTYIHRKEEEVRYENY